ncbi:HAD hydrolase-like protein [Jeotgalibaca porci]
MDTLLALTGVTTVEDLEEITNKPTHILNDLSEWRFE